MVFLQRCLKTLRSLRQSAIAGEEGKILESLNEKGKVCFCAGEQGHALAVFDQILTISPCYVPALVNRGVVLKSIKKLDAALSSFEMAVKVEPANANAHFNKGLTLLEMNRQLEALVSFDSAINAKPDFFEAYSSKGVALKNQGLFSEAFAAFDAALEINPEFVDANWNRALLLLLLARFREGWEAYEWRWRRDEMAVQRHFESKHWLGEFSVIGKTLLIYPEQGLGDVIQFCRYALALQKIGVNVILAVPRVLVSLISTIDEKIRVFEAGAESLFSDFQCPVMSLPFALRTELTHIPAQVPYIFAEENIVSKWRQQLSISNKPKIGLVWSGNKSHSNDHNRSIPFDVFLKILDLPFEFHSLQPNIESAEEREEFRKKGGVLHAGGLGDFSDTAGLVEVMDLVITVDTSVAHLAGAMGKTVWILLPFVPDFRWLLERNDSPWYPTATLFRQPKIGDWKSVILDVIKYLRQRYSLK